MDDPVRKLVETRPDFFANRPAHQDKAAKITDFIHASPGLSYAYLITTPAGRIVVNTGMGFEAPTHKKVFDAVMAGPTPYILLTQGHVDHLGGVSLFREPGTKLIAQRNNAACQRDDARISRVPPSRASICWGGPTRAGAAQQQQTPTRVVQDTPTPDIPFDDRHDLELGGLKLELLSVPG